MMRRGRTFSATETARRRETNNHHGRWCLCPRSCRRLRSHLSLPLPLVSLVLAVSVWISFRIDDGGGGGGSFVDRPSAPMMPSLGVYGASIGGSIVGRYSLGGAASTSNGRGTGGREALFPPRDAGGPGLRGGGRQQLMFGGEGSSRSLTRRDGVRDSGIGADAFTTADAQVATGAGAEGTGLGAPGVAEAEEEREDDEGEGGVDTDNAEDQDRGNGGTITKAEGEEKKNSKDFFVMIDHDDDPPPSSASSDASSRAPSVSPPSDVIKTDLVSQNKVGNSGNATPFDDLSHTGGVSAIRATAGHEIDGIQLVYRDLDLDEEYDGGWFGSGGPPGTEEHVLLEREGVTRIVAKEHEGNYGMEYLKFYSESGRAVAEVTTLGSDGGAGAVRVFVAPEGYVLGGIHGLTGEGDYADGNERLITVGFYWVRKAPASPTVSPAPSMFPTPSPSAMPSVSSVPSTSSMPSFNADMVDNSTLNGKIMAGYQGWFLAPNDSSGQWWRHWSVGQPNPETVTVDMWPDLREYDADELYVLTNFSYADGRGNASLFSSYNPKTVRRHVGWMHEYGIDGVFVQRFLTEVTSASMLPVRDRVLDNVRQSSEEFGRIFANMYDLSKKDFTSPSLTEVIMNDWKHLVDDLKITRSPSYLHHEGRPVLALWGFGVEGRPHTPVEANEVLDWFTNEDTEERYRVTLMGGIDPTWRSHSEDWMAVYDRFDIISPWSVTRFDTISGADSFRAVSLEPDLDYLSERGNVDYMPVVFPGFSWYNLMNGAADFNRIPRLGGRFLWRQLYNAMEAGASMIYVAMFDEVDEATAIFKVAENANQTPTTGKFLTLDADGEAVPSDWYLYLVGEATRSLRAGGLIEPELPLRGDGHRLAEPGVPVAMGRGSTVEWNTNVNWEHELPKVVHVEACDPDFFTC